MKPTLRSVRRGMFAGLLALAPMLPMPAYTAGSTAELSGVVYHIDGAAQALPAIRNISNHLKAVPTLTVVVVALAQGVDFLLKDAKDDRGNPYEPMIDDLLMAGVEFRVCNNTLVGRQIDKRRLHPDVAIVESGVAEITRLQLSEGYAYIKP